METGTEIWVCPPVGDNLRWDVDNDDSAVFLISDVNRIGVPTVVGQNLKEFPIAEEDTILLGTEEIPTELNVLNEDLAVPPSAVECPNVLPIADDVHTVVLSTSVVFFV